MIAAICTLLQLQLHPWYMQTDWNVLSGPDQLWDAVQRVSDLMQHVHAAVRSLQRSSVFLRQVLVRHALA